MEYVLGGIAPVSLGSLTAAMLGTHIFIGIGEAFITGLTVAAVLAARPDLVDGAGEVPRTHETDDWQPVGAAS